MKHRNTRLTWVQGGLAALFVLILLFLVFAPASKAQGATDPISGHGSHPSESLTGTLDVRPGVSPTPDRRHPS